jgi:hypothetical protein
MTEHVLSEKRQKSGKFPCPADGVDIRITGNFLSGMGVGTSVALYNVIHLSESYHRERSTSDRHYSHGPVKLVRTFNEPGDYRVVLEEGLCFFQAAGPDGLPWEVSIQILESEPRQRKPTLEQRLKALEERA